MMLKLTLPLLLSLFSASALAQPILEHRAGFIDCGKSQVRALAECYERTQYCTTETLSFARRAGRTIVPVHALHVLHDVGGTKAKTLEYHATSWACLPGKSGGHYLV